MNVARLGPLSACACALGLAACRAGTGASASEDVDASALTGGLSREQLRDPEVCQDCHPDHYREWSSSMHAYSAKDPVFVAMNKRGQRETRGKLGDFCIRCHAPMAVFDKRSRDGLNLDPEKERGVTCYFCHDTVGVEADHNGMLRLANDTTMRGPIRDPRAPGAHRAESAETFDDTSPKSTTACGGCHDIVTQAGVHLERTFQEYREGIFSKSATGAPPAFDSCVGCHMPGRRALIATVPGAPLRLAHEHLWPGIDLPLTPFPHSDVLRSAVEDCQLGKSVYVTLEATPPNLFSFQIETNAGHNQPSGAAQDRRMWLEVSAFDGEGKLLDGASSGRIADGELEDRPPEDPKRDPRLLMFRDRIYDGEGKPVHMFWEAAMSAAHPAGYESNVLPAASTTYVQGKHVVLKQYRLAGPHGEAPARVTARLRIRPIGVDVLEELVASGDLDPSLVTQMPTLTFSAQIDWTPADGWMKSIAAAAQADCNKYRCLFDPGSDECTRGPAPTEPRKY